ncbi:hypothetical protein SAMD00019534_069570 [Acytostelium subglobosum LB1]|uniref:hypothetical protein n=1 Tax=Acytostelium subglobosum LB1 TaxID=1410327 RepID=UPI000644A93D|nr:hypothetical protein SAMD00019534_069570 [Acytostelium subglobosum LB1]GAM23782.1 hypothetical protein SAMD00019534_069570 [Acytostelium subglobosum LB1]|eukprot:XP_012753523.1 hypothetical protein SAMD00019534_069570 [Acytostelium subglobosum LB1]
MSNLQAKERIDLTPRTLTLTSVDDKVWLGIPEENLFNDSFTIEKYYMLQSKPFSNFRDADHFKAIEQIEQSFFPSYKDRFESSDQSDDSDSGTDQSTTTSTTTSKATTSSSSSGATGTVGQTSTSSQSSPTSTTSTTSTGGGAVNTSNNNNVTTSSSTSGNSTPPRSQASRSVATNQNRASGGLNSNNNSSSNNNNNNNNNNNIGTSGRNSAQLQQPATGKRKSNTVRSSTEIASSSSGGVSSGTTSKPPAQSSSTSAQQSANASSTTQQTATQSSSANNSTAQSVSGGGQTAQSIGSNPFHEESRNRQNIPVYLIDEDPFHTHQITSTLILEDLYSQSNVNTAYYSTLLQKRLCILKRIHLALKREIARKKLFDSVYHSKAKTRTKKVHTPPISIRIACRLFITTLQEQVFEQRISLPTLKSFNLMIQELPPLSLAGEPQDCIDSLTSWLLSAISTNIVHIKREAMEALISLTLSQGSLNSILFALSLIIMPDRLQQHLQGGSKSSASVAAAATASATTGAASPPHQSSNTGSGESFSPNASALWKANNNEPLTLRLIPIIRQLEQWKVDLPLSPLTRDLLFATWPMLWNDNASQDSLAFLSSPNPNIATITSDGDYIYIHDNCGLAKIGTGYSGTHQGRIYARNGHWFPKEKGWLVSIDGYLYYRSPSTDQASLIVIDPVTLQEVGRINQDGSGSLPTTNNLTLPFGPETTQSSSLEDESMVLATSAFHLTTRSPMFTDGRYLYILSLQRFHHYKNNKQFIVDMYDPFHSFKHIKRIELRYPDSDVNEEVVLNPVVLELGSFYTNGQYLMVVLPPPLGSDYNADAKSYLCRAFSLTDGSLIGNYCLESQPIGLASTYDYVNNVIWNYSSIQSEVGRYGNEGFGPKHTFPTGLPLRESQSPDHTSVSPSATSATTSTSSTTTHTFMPLTESTSSDMLGLEPKQIVSTVLGMLSRLSIDYMPSISDNNTIHHLYKLNEPYSVEVTYSTFSQLYSILKHYQAQIRVDASIGSPKNLDILRCIIYSLRLLKVNLFRLTSNIRSLERSQQHYQDSSRDSLLKCVDQTFLYHLRDLLLGFIIEGISGSSSSGSSSPPNNLPPLPKHTFTTTTTQQELPEFNSIIEESCEVLTIGLDLFYPTSLDKANFVKMLLEEVMNHRKALASSLSKQSNKHQKEKGYSMLLNSVLSLLANHPNASFFALPPLLSEIPSPFSVFSTFGAEYPSDKPFDPMNLFVPIIKHLLVEAQATIPKQSLEPQRQDPNNQNLGFSFFSSAPPPPLASSSPAMRLLLAVQKDLVLRVENSVVGTDAPSQALVAYSRLLMDKCKELLLGVLDSETPQRSQSILLMDFKSSVVGALLPTLIHSLFLFSHHIWLAKEMLPSLVPLIGVVDRINRRLPKLLNRPELGRQPLQKRSSFVEGPSRISESPHPYHPFMNTRQVVSIPGSVFLSLVFDERSMTSTADDVLQIYESADSKEPMDKFSLSQWPKRRFLIPGDTVVFQFVTGSASGITNPYAFWGYRCNIIGHMPNSDKTSLPWSSHLEKTMCCLAGRFSASLICGDTFTDLEYEHRQTLESPLFQGSIEEEYVSQVLFGPESNLVASPHPNPKPQPCPIDVMSTPQASQSSQWQAIQRFCVSLAKRNNEVYSQSLSDFMWHYITGEPLKGKGSIKTAQQATIAALIKHLGLSELAMNFALEIIQFRCKEMVEGKAESGIMHQLKPPQQLVDVWKSVGHMRHIIIQRHQENLNNNLGNNTTSTTGSVSNEDESANRRSVHATLRETIYKDVTDKIVDRAMFLMQLQSCNNSDEPNKSKEAQQQVWSDITSSVINFSLSNISLDVIKMILATRRSRAYTRGLGLQAMIDILRCTSDHTMKHEVLCYIGPALRNSGFVKQRSPPFHYLDHLRGCGSRLLLDIKKTFRLLMEDIAALLQDPNSDSTLRVYALDAFTLNFTSEDADLLTSVDIFNKIHNLMTNESVWGGLWTSGSVPAAQGQSPINNMLLHTLGSSSSGGTHTGSLFSNSGGNNNFSSVGTFIDEERQEKERLKKNAKALFRFLGLICVGAPNNSSSNKPQTSKDAASMSKSLETLRDTFFQLVETQLDSSLAYLQEQNKTYWLGSYLPMAGTTPPITGKGRRILRGERSFNNDFNDTLSLLYILSAFNSVKSRLTAPSFLQIFHCILQVGDETHRKLTLRIFRRILPYVSPESLVVPTGKSKHSSSSIPPTSAAHSFSTPQPPQPTSGAHKSLFTLLLDIVGAISYWGCTSDLLETAKYIDPRFFITASNYNLFFSSNYSTKIDSSPSFFSIFDKNTVLPTCWDTSTVQGVRFSNDAKMATFSSMMGDTVSGIIRSDNVIPESIPLFYFELKIENDLSASDNVNAPVNCVIGLVAMSHVSQLRTLRDWKYGYGFSGKDGHKACHRVNSSRSRKYAASFTRNDVVGCGWNRKEGKVFFTKNGKYLGTAFKNVFGDYYPAVQLGSNVSLSVNFGASPFLYDVTPLTSSHLEQTISEKNMPSMSLSYVSEVISLLRILLRAPLWKPHMQRYIEEGLNLLPSTIVQDTLRPMSPPATKSLLQVFSTITMLAGHLDGIWNGARVQVDLGSGRHEKGTVIEYSPLSNLCRVLLDSNIPKLYRTVHHRRNLKPITEIAIDFGQFLPSSSSILPSLSVFLRPTSIPTAMPSMLLTPPSSTSDSQSSKHQSMTFRTEQRNIYLFVKSRVMKVLGYMFKHPECAKYSLEEILVPILVEFALGRPIQFIDEPKIEKMERLSFLIKERIYDSSFKLFITAGGDTSGPSIPAGGGGNNKEPEDLGTITDINDLDDEDNEMLEEIEEFDDMGVIDLEGDDSLDSNRPNNGDPGSRGDSGPRSHRKKGSGDGSGLHVKSRHNSTNNNNSNNPELDEVDSQNVANDDDENLTEDDIPEEGIPGKRISWGDIQPGMSVMISRREKLVLCRSNWVLDMDRIIGAVGIVKSIDKKHKQVLVTVLDEDTFSLVDWWLCYEVLIHPPSPDKSTKNPLQSIDKYSHSQLVQLDASSELALSILFARQALISLLVSLPNNIRVAYTSFGGAKNLIYILKLTLQTSLLNSFGGKKTFNNNSSITKLFSSISSNAYMHKDLQNLKMLQSKLTYLIRQETQLHPPVFSDVIIGQPATHSNGTHHRKQSTPVSLSTGSFSERLEKQLSFNEKSLAALSSSLGPSLGASLASSLEQLSSTPANSGSGVSTGSSSPGDGPKWRSYKPPMTPPIGALAGNSLGEPLKSGNLMKQQKIIKLWKRVFVVLSSETLYYYKSSQGQTQQTTATLTPTVINSFSKETSTLAPIGSIDLRDIVSVTQVSIPKQSKLFNKKDYCFQVTVASNKTHLFQTSTQEELNDWLQIINTAYNSSPSVRSKANTLTSNSLVDVLVKECALQLKDTAHKPLPQLVDESPHPYPANYKCKKIIRIEGALSLLIVFDSRTSTEPGYGMLKLYYDPCCTDHIASFSGNVASFPPTLVHAGQCWMIFNADSPNSDWGYKFTVTPIRMRTSDVSLLPNPNFEFACFLVDWILQLEMHHFTTKYPNYFSNDLVELLLQHLEVSQPLDRKLKVINFLARILQKQSESNSFTSKLDHLKEEMFKLYKFERQINPSGGGNTLLSQYLQRLIELCVHVDINKTQLGLDIHASSPSSSGILNSGGGNNRNQQHAALSPDQDYRAWYYRTLKTYKVLDNLFKGKGFNREFIKESFVGTRHKQVVDSPHPYPQGVRVTANILIPNAISLKVEFDPKSKTQTYVDYLMFSKSTPGGDDLGFFTGDFPTQQPILIAGDRFIWSFYSDSTESEWGFRFTVTPIFPDDIQKEHELQYDREIEYLFSKPWNHSLDQELVKFVNTVCEKQKKTPSQLIFDQCLTTEYLMLFPQLFGVNDPMVLQLRFIILKHFNTCCQSFLQYIDLRGASEDWSIAYRLCSLRGLLFYDIKLEVLGSSLQSTRFFGRRPMLYLNRNGTLFSSSSSSAASSAAGNTLSGAFGHTHNLRQSHYLNSNDYLLIHQQPSQILQQQQQQHAPKNMLSPPHGAQQSESLFFQAFRQIGMMDPSRLRHNDRAWEVKLEREGARDAGGPYRESITQIISDLQSVDLNLFLPCHNAQGDVAFNRDKLVPNSSANSPFSLQLFEFVGRLIGIAIRTKNCIEVSFPSIFWKALVCARVDRLDLEAIDKYCTNMLEMMRSPMDKDVFNDLIFQTFTSRSIDNSTVELVQDGKSREVIWENRLEYARMLEMYKLNEFKLQIDAIAKGVASIVPLHLLNIYTWQELQLRVCGMPGLDIKLLKRHTRYIGLHPNEPRVVWFWRILETFSSEEQTLLLRFVWGRSRLPSSHEFTFQFQLQVFIRNDSTLYDDDYETGIGGHTSRMSIDENQDEYLPEAKTCFFTLSLPNYSSQDVMREKLLYAITTCREIDADFIIPDDSSLPALISSTASIVGGLE